MYELWPKDITEKSKHFLIELKSIDLDFVLIGGWAVYLISKYSESRDIDMLVPQKELWKLRTYIMSKGGEEKTNPLGKTGYKLNEVELDVYTDKLNNLPVDIDKVFEEKQFIEIEGFKVLQPELLLKLKIKAEEARKMSHKGLKDRCDILSILNTYKIDAKKISNEDRQRLEKIIHTNQIEYEYIMKKKLNPSDIKKMKTKLLDCLNS